MDFRNVKDLGNKFLVAFLVFGLGLILLGVAWTAFSFEDMEASSLSKTEQAASILTQIQPLKLEIDTKSIDIQTLQAEINVAAEKVNTLKAQYNSVLGLQ